MNLVGNLNVTIPDGYVIIVDMAMQRKYILVLSCLFIRHQHLAINGFILGRSAISWDAKSNSGVPVGLILNKAMLKTLLPKRYPNLPLEAIKLTQDWQVCRQFDIGEFGTQWGHFFKNLRAKTNTYLIPCYLRVLLR